MVHVRTMKPELLDTDSLNAALKNLSGWQMDGDCLKKRFSFDSYLKGATFVQYAAECAEGMDHHPDLLLGWKRVDVTLTTHSAGGITALDVKLARQIDALGV